jgi:hypothetical protein
MFALGIIRLEGKSPCPSRAVIRFELWEWSHIVLTIPDPPPSPPLLSDESKFTVLNGWKKKYLGNISDTPSIPLSRDN